MKNFEELYSEFNNNTELLKVAEEAAEEKRKRNLLTLLLCFTIDAVIILLIYRNLKDIVFSIATGIFPIFIIDIIVFIIMLIVFRKKQNEYLPLFKTQVIKRMINNFFTNAEYYPNKQLPRSMYDEGLYNERYNKYFSDDYIEAKIDEKYLINIAEVKTQEEETYTDSDGNTHTTTTTKFNGLFAKIEMEKSLNSSLRITNNHTHYKDRLEMDSSEFEKSFNVFATNKIIGMQLLTADIMEDFLEFKNKTNQKFDIFIIENIIYLRFHCGAMFEPKSLKKGVLDEKSLNIYYDILKFTYYLPKKMIKLIEETEI